MRVFSIFTEKQAQNLFDEFQAFFPITFAQSIPVKFYNATNTLQAGLKNEEINLEIIVNILVSVMRNI